MTPDDRDGPRVWAAHTFLRSFKPIESIVDGLPIPRGGLTSITGPTGSAKTTLCAALEVAIVKGRRFAGREVTRGSVLVLAGENADDFAGHLLATLQDQGIDVAEISDRETRDNLMIVPGTFNVQVGLDYLAAKVQAHCSPLAAVVVDTSAAYYLGDDENGNANMRQHAAGLRELATLPGRPAVIVLCHPVKNATQDNLLPRGAGAFLAEVDANLTTWKDSSGLITLGWAGKIRGSAFDPIRFELHPVELAGIRDCRGKPITSVAVRHVPDDRAELLEAKALDDENRLLVTMLRHPDSSVAELGRAGGFTLANLQPAKSRVSRILEKLDQQGLAKKNRAGTWELTSQGKRAAQEIR